MDYDGIHIVGTTYDKALQCARYGNSVLAAFETLSANLAILAERIGSIHAITGDLLRGLSLFERFRAIIQSLLAEAPGDSNLKANLAISYSKLGETHTALGNLQQALTYFDERNRLGQELYAAYPENVSFKNGLAISWIKLGWFYTDTRQDREQAILFYTQAKVMLTELVRDYPAYAEFRRNLDWVNRQLPEA